MFHRLRKLLIGFTVGACWTLPAMGQTAIAQTATPAATPSVTPTLGAGNVNTVIGNTGTFTITGGTQQLNTLFHSFETFSPGATDVLFELAGSQSDVETVISRVTGGNASFLDSQLLLTGGNRPDIFLINPHGITFGENSRLAVPGSFVASSAASVMFQDGRVFSAVNPDAAPLLTVSAPTGLNLGTAPAPIVVQGNGHALNNTLRLSLPFYGTVDAANLSVQPNETLALIGGAITLDGGILTGEHSDISLGAVGQNNAAPMVVLTANETGWAADYSKIEQFADIELNDRSLIADRSAAPGNIDITGANLSVVDGSLVLLETQGSGPAGDITINVSDVVNIDGAFSATMPSGVAGYTVSDGPGGDINLTARQLLVREQAQLGTATSADGAGGKLSINATDLVELESTAVNELGAVQGRTSLLAIALRNGDAGALDITTRKLKLGPGTNIAGATFFGTGQGGDIRITATDEIEVVGQMYNLDGTNNSFGSAFISASSYASGLTGSVDVNTARLRLQNGGYLGAGNFGTAQGGTVTVNATESIQISGQRTEVNGFLNAPTIPSQINVGSRQLTPRFPIPSGDSGSAYITTPLLVLTDYGEIELLNEGTGRGGELVVNANSVWLSDRAKIEASTNAGAGGNITLNLDDILLMRRESVIRAEASGVSNMGNGGNITINAPVIVGLENSDIVANAVQGNGGNVSLNTQSLLGIEFREAATLESDITVSSEFGVNGTVEINNLTLPPDAGLVKLPESPDNSEDRIATACSGDGANHFIASGRGGIRTLPTQSLMGSRPWRDVRNVFAGNVFADSVFADSVRAQPVPMAAVSATSTSATSSTVEAIAPEAAYPSGDALLEATRWQVDSNGQVEFSTAVHPAHAQLASANCLAPKIHQTP